MKFQQKNINDLHSSDKSASPPTQQSSLFESLANRLIEKVKKRKVEFQRKIYIYNDQDMKEFNLALKNNLISFQFQNQRLQQKEI